MFQVSFLGSELVFSCKSLRFYKINLPATLNALKKLSWENKDGISKVKNLRAHSRDKDIKVALQFNKLPFFFFH